MFKSLIGLIIVSSFLAFPTIGNSTKVSSTSVVTLVGAHIKARSTPINIKYNRKDCPVCKGTGWYVSGDGIERVDCGYCEDKSSQSPHHN